MEFGVDFDQTTVDLGREMTCNFHEDPCHIFCRVYFPLSQSLPTLPSRFSKSVLKVPCFVHSFSMTAVAPLQPRIDISVVNKLPDVQYLRNLVGFVNF